MDVSTAAEKLLLKASLVWLCDSPSKGTRVSVGESWESMKSEESQDMATKNDRVAFGGERCGVTFTVSLFDRRVYKLLTLSVGACYIVIILWGFHSIIMLL